MMWKLSTVEDIRAWFAGEYVPNPTAEEFQAAWLARIRRAVEDGSLPRHCLVPRNHPSQQWSKSATDAHDHDWVDMTRLSDVDRRELCTVCGEERMVPRP